ncbi:MAG: ATP-binding protein [Anaerolineales bacterium]
MNSKKVFLVPKDHVLEEVLKFGNELAQSSEDAKEFIFDFQGKGLDTPFGMLYLGFAIRRFIENHPRAVCVPINYAERGYAAYMGYFQACGFEIGNMPGHTKGTDTYIPITILSVSELKAQARDEIREVGEVIEDRSRELARILTQHPDGPLTDTLTYSLREMIRNIVEHSQSESLAFCAQFRAKVKQAEIAILDTGIGIRESLSNNPYLKIANDHEALNLALMAGISGKQFKGIKRDPYNFWQNSGFGLFAVSRLCGHGGKFTICSGDTTLTLKPNEKVYHPASYQGTALRIILSAKEIENSKSLLPKIMKEGAQQAKELETANAEPSTASKMLSTEFSKKK